MRSPKWCNQNLWRQSDYEITNGRLLILGFNKRQKIAGKENKERPNEWPGLHFILVKERFAVPGRQTPSIHNLFRNYEKEKIMKPSEEENFFRTEMERESRSTFDSFKGLKRRRRRRRQRRCRHRRWRCRYSCSRMIGGFLNQISMTTNSIEKRKILTTTKNSFRLKMASI